MKVECWLRRRRRCASLSRVTERRIRDEPSNQSSSVRGRGDCGRRGNGPNWGGPGPRAKPALLGGKPVHAGSHPSWPVVTPADEQSVLEVVHAGRWYRDRSVEQFERAFAPMHSAKHCVAVSSGTSALYTSLGALGVGPGDEVIVPPYTFCATVNVAMLHYAMPVFVDSDRETFQMDAAKLEAAITRAHGGDHPRAHWRIRGRSGQYSCYRRAAQRAGDRGRLPGGSGPLAGPRLGKLGHVGLFQFPGEQERLQR